jgi:hypothetical protein
MKFLRLNLTPVTRKNEIVAVKGKGEAPLSESSALLTATGNNSWLFRALISRGNVTKNEN